VFLCRCGGCIGDVVDLDQVAKGTRELDGVALVQIDDYLCSMDGLRRMRKTVDKKSLDGIVVGACSPRLRLADFQSALEHVGVRRQFVEMANIREQCAWIHWQDIVLASAKASDMVGMAVAKVLATDPSEQGCLAVVNSRICDGCGTCMSVCRLKAIDVVADPSCKGKKIAMIDAKLCDGCGACVAACPSGAMDQGCFSNEQIVAQIDFATNHRDAEAAYRPKILVFACNWCSYPAADLAGVKRLEIDPHFQILRTMCSSRVDPEWILRAFSRGVDGVLVLAGRPGECHYEVGNLRTRKRIALLKQMITQLGFREERLMLGYVDSDEPEEFQRKVNSYVDLILELGPNPLRIPPAPEKEMTST
jgi:coenzyme F420-reducing hydrogenase delta subunit/ferredoxin